jgi:hypothetical protein
MDQRLSALASGLVRTALGRLDVIGEFTANPDCR